MERMNSHFSLIIFILVFSKFSRYFMVFATNHFLQLHYMLISSVISCHLSYWCFFFFSLEFSFVYFFKIYLVDYAITVVPPPPPGHLFEASPCCSWLRSPLWSPWLGWVSLFYPLTELCLFPLWYLALRTVVILHLLADEKKERNLFPS